VDEELHIHLLRKPNEDDLGIHAAAENLRAEIEKVLPAGKAMRVDNSADERGVEIGPDGPVLVTLIRLPGDVDQVVGTIRQWLLRQSERRVILQLGEHRVELSNFIPVQQHELVEHKLSIQLLRRSVDDDHDIDRDAENLREEIDPIAPARKVMSEDVLPKGTKAGEIALIGHLLVTLIHSSSELAKVMDTIHQWLGRQLERKIILQIGEDRLELSNVTSETQQKLVAVWIDMVQQKQLLRNTGHR
jgi:hypothetical protein